jgi:glutamyl-tRNA(Gln) amidotransferase subunit E
MKAGLEVHQQLATGKLFCECPAELSESVTGTIVRRLRATGGENHTIDPAAAFQAARGLLFRYEAASTSCLVELDEEPPHELSRYAVEVALTMALMLKARPVDEIQVMRKIVVDGSNTAGFQRTALIAVDGELRVGERRYSIISICLEEDAARKVAEARGEVRYRLDRLGIPLIEIATGPEITTGGEAREVAEEIGALLRATRKVRRGIGTIREDLNVSTEGGARVEIKGVQELRLLERFAEGEEARQRVLLQVRDELRRRNAGVPDDPPIEVTHLIGPAAQGAVADTIRHGGVVLGIRLGGFAGLLRSPSGETERLGRELADYARATGLKGLLHSDELPGSGITEEIVGRLRQELRVTGQDAFILVAAPDAGRAELALATVRSRAKAALVGIPEETRDPLPDGRTRYSRPLPGRDRMYPETDVPPVAVAREIVDRLRENLPEHPDVLRARLAITYSLDPQVIRQLQRTGELERFEGLVHAGHSASSVARLLTQDLPGVQETLEGDDAPVLPTSTLEALLSAVDRSEFAKEGVPAVLAALHRGAKTIPEAVAAAGLESMSREDLVELTDRLISANAAMVREKGSAAFSGLMGDLMREVRGRRDGKEVASVLRAALSGAGPGLSSP